MKRTGPIKRKTKLVSRTKLKATKPINKRSKKAKGKDEERKRVRALVLRSQRGLCGIGIYHAGVRCMTMASEVHERRSRAQGGSILNVVNLVGLCPRCHAWAHNHPAIARKIGLVVHRGDVPADVYEALGRP